MRTKILTILIFITCQGAFGYIPSFESLLRNGNNMDIGKNTLVAKMIIKNESEPAEKSEAVVIKDDFIKYVIYNEKENNSQLVELKYTDMSFNLNRLYDIDVIPFNELSNISKNKEKIEQRFYFALMGILLTNNGSLMIDFLQEQGINVSGNSELIDQPKLKLLKEYKYYLDRKKNDKEGADLRNPLTPEDDEQRVKVKEALKRPLIKEDNIVKRFKNGHYFGWLVDNEKMSFVFNDNHQLEEIKIMTIAGEISAQLGKFILHGANFQFPEFVKIKTPTGKEYKITLNSLSYFPDNSAAHFKRLKTYQKSIKENQISTTDIENPLTL